MTALLTSLASGVGGYIMAGVGVILALVTALLTARKSGQQSQQVADAQRSAKDDATANKARSTVDGLSSAAVDDKLRQFQRK